MNVRAKLLIAVLAGLAIAAQAQAETRIIYATYLGTKHSTVPVLEKYFEQVEANTNGSVVFEFHPGASLLGIKAIPSGVRDGIADAGYFVGAVVPSELKVDAYLSEYGVYGVDPLVMSGVYNDLVLFHCPQCQGEYREGFGVIPLAGYASTPYFLQCKDPVRSLADLDGRKVKATAARAELARVLGAEPFNVNANETYEALERGTIDCVFGAITHLKTRSYWEVTKHVIEEPMGTWFGASLMNLRLDKWKALSESEREAMVRHLPMLVSNATFNYIEQDKEVQKAAAEEHGVSFDAAPSDMRKTVADFRSTYGEMAIENGRQRGVDAPREIDEAFFQLLDKWTKLVGDRTWTREEYGKLLWNEVYGKMKLQP